MLLPHRSVHPMQQVLPDGLQLPHYALGLRLPFDHEPAAPGPCAVVREAQDVEGLRASLPGSCSSLGGEPPELDQRVLPSWSDRPNCASLSLSATRSCLAS